MFYSYISNDIVSQSPDKRHIIYGPQMFLNNNIVYGNVIETHLSVNILC